MTTAIAPELKPDRFESAPRSTLGHAPAEPAREQLASSYFDPTQGRQIGSDPYDDPTQGRRIGSHPYDDPTRAR
jgi:hypothetical protein